MNIFYIIINFEKNTNILNMTIPLSFSTASCFNTSSDFPLLTYIKNKHHIKKYISLQHKIKHVKLVLD